MSLGTNATVCRTVKCRRVSRAASGSSTPAVAVACPLVPGLAGKSEDLTLPMPKAKSAVPRCHPIEPRVVGRCQPTDDETNPSDVVPDHAAIRSCSASSVSMRCRAVRPANSRDSDARHREAAGCRGAGFAGCDSRVVAARCGHGADPMHFGIGSAARCDADPRITAAPPPQGPPSPRQRSPSCRRPTPPGRYAARSPPAQPEPPGPGPGQRQHRRAG